MPFVVQIMEKERKNTWKTKDCKRYYHSNLK
nr:MAG TPA: hypothetical protein [Caudoviricetes sp.]